MLVYFITDFVHLPLKLAMGISFLYNFSKFKKDMFMSPPLLKVCTLVKIILIMDDPLQGHLFKKAKIYLKH